MRHQRLIDGGGGGGGRFVFDFGHHTGYLGVVAVVGRVHSGVVDGSDGTSPPVGNDGRNCGM